MFDDGLCRSDAQPQRDLGAQASPSQMRSPDHEVGVQTLVDDARTATPPPAADVGAQGSTGDVGASTSPPVTDVDPINAVPSTSDQDFTGDPIQLEQSPKNPETSGAQVPSSPSTGPTLRRTEIDWNGTPWQEDIFDDNEDMRAARNAILTLNEALTISISPVLFVKT